MPILTSISAIFSLSDFTGYWVLSKVEQLDEFLKALGVPWVVRKAAAKFGTNSCDVISHIGSTVRISSLNPKGSWTRVYDTERKIDQPNAEGVKCKTTTWWEGPVLRTRMEGSPLGICDSWRYRRGDTMVVKTSMKPKSDEDGAKPEATCFWFFERMQSLQRHVAGSNRALLLKALAADHKRVEQATRRDNVYLQKVLLDWNRWNSPADEFIKVAMSAPYAPRRPHGSTSRLRSRASPAGSPMGISQSPSASSLTALASHEARAEVQRSRLGSALGSVSASEGDKATEHGATPDQSIAPPQRAGDSVTSGSAPSMMPRVRPSPLGSSSGNGGGGDTSSAVSNTTELPNGVSGLRLAPGNSQGSEGGPNAPGHARKRSMESIGGGAGAVAAAAAATVHRQAVHYRSPSTESISYSLATPAGSPPMRQPPTGAEALMVFKLHEFLDGRGIASVVPVANPNDTSEPQLLGMSPEQAEETAAKLRELETDMLLGRQDGARGWACCGLVLSRENDSLPDHLRVWEMTLA